MCIQHRFLCWNLSLRTDFCTHRKTPSPKAELSSSFVVSGAEPSFAGGGQQNPETGPAWIRSCPWVGGDDMTCDKASL